MTMADSTGRSGRPQRELAHNDDAPWDPMDADENSDQDATQSAAQTSKKRKRSAGDAATPNSKYAELLPGRMPACYVSQQDNKFFTAAWFKEISARDAFWTDWIGKIPKGVIKARFGIQFNMSLDGDEHSQVPLIPQQRRVRDKPAPTTTKVNADRESRAQVATEPNNEDGRPAEEDAQDLAMLNDQGADKAGVAAPHPHVTGEPVMPQVTPSSQLLPSRSISIPYIQLRHHLRPKVFTEPYNEPRKATARNSMFSSLTPELRDTTSPSTPDSLTPELDATSPLKLKISRASQSPAGGPAPTASSSTPKDATKAHANAAEPDKDLNPPKNERLPEIKPSNAVLPHHIKQEPPSLPHDIKPKPDPSPATGPAANSIDCATFIHDGETHFVKQEALREMVSVGGAAFYVVRLAGGQAHVPVGGGKWSTKKEMREAKIVERERRMGRKGAVRAREGVVKIEVE